VKKVRRRTSSTDPRRIWGAGFHAGQASGRQRPGIQNAPWAILEVETGYMDGWYHDAADAGMVAHWDGVRPNFRHVVVRQGPEFHAIPDHMWLADHWLSFRGGRRE
jgi:hypothetical protein